MTRSTQTNEDTGTDTLVDTRGSSKEGAADKADRTPSNNEPATTVNIAQTTDERESNRISDGVSSNDPDVVRGWP